MPKRKAYQQTPFGSYVQNKRRKSNSYPTRQQQIGSAMSDAYREFNPNNGYNRTAGYYGRFSGPNAELKFFDGTKTTATLAATGTILSDSLNKIPQGVTESTRVGRKCVIKKLFIKGMVKKVTSTVAAGSIANIVSGGQYRFIVYLDKQANGATAAVTDILETADINSFRNLANTQRFVVLADVTKTINATAGASDGTNYSSFMSKQTIKFSKACNIPLEFSSTTGAITELRSNNIGVLALSQEANSIQLDYQWRLRFDDS